VLGRGLRFLFGAALLVLFVVWVDANEIVTMGQVQEQASEVLRVVREAARSSDFGILREFRWTIPVNWARLEQPVDFDLLPSSLRGRIHGSDLGVAAAILLLSAFSARWRTGVFALLASLLVLFGPGMGLAIGGLSPTLSPHAQARLLGLLVFFVGSLPRLRRRLTNDLGDPGVR
jgi:hypothetical protein